MIVMGRKMRALDPTPQPKLNYKFWPMMLMTMMPWDRMAMNGYNNMINHRLLGITNAPLATTTTQLLSSPSASPLPSASPSPLLSHTISSSFSISPSSPSTSLNYGANIGHGDGSPIPYLLAGLAAMLGLIAVSLFILACSYWKLVGYSAHSQHQQNQQLAQLSPHASSQPLNIRQDEMSSSHCSKGPSSNRLKDASKLAVIMAGHDIPTFLAQPIDRVDGAPDEKLC